MTEVVNHPTSLYSLFNRHFHFNCLSTQTQRSLETDTLCSISLFTSSTTCVNFINILHAHFSYEYLFSAKSLALNKLSYKKRAHKMLMKSTEGVPTQHETLERGNMMSFHLKMRNTFNSDEF